MKRQRKKFLRPSHPWEKDRMDAEDKMLNQFGLRRKEEIWRTHTLLRDFRGEARNLLTVSGAHAERETKQLLNRLQKLGLVGAGATLDDVFGLTTEKILKRRLQTLVLDKGLAKTPQQARQLVVHGHIAIGAKRVNVPGYLVPVDEESLISYAGSSTFKLTPPETTAAPVAKPSEDEKAETPPAQTEETAKEQSGGEA